jgi:predicted deacetylase
MQTKQANYLCNYISFRYTLQSLSLFSIITTSVKNNHRWMSWYILCLKDLKRARIKIRYTLFKTEE